jgi:hypothetical protein
MTPMNQSSFNVALLVAGLAALSSCNKNTADEFAASESVPGSTVQEPQAKTETKHCVAGGTATVAGSVKETDLAAVTTAWFYAPVPGMTAIAFQEEGMSCGMNESLTVALMLCGKEAKTYTVTEVPDEGPNCETSPNAAFVLAEDRSGIDLGQGSGGTVTLNHSGTGCLAGTFEVEIDTQSVTGSFEAMFCKDMKPPAQPE